MMEGARHQHLHQEWQEPLEEPPVGPSLGLRYTRDSRRKPLHRGSLAMSGSAGGLTLPV